MAYLFYKTNLIFTNDLFLFDYLNQINTAWAQLSALCTHIILKREEWKQDRLLILRGVKRRIILAYFPGPSLQYLLYYLTYFLARLLRSEPEPGPAVVRT